MLLQVRILAFFELRKGDRQVVTRSKEQNSWGTGKVLIFFFFLGPQPKHMEVPRLGVELELQLLAYAIARANTRSELCLQPIPQLTEMPAP